MPYRVSKFIHLLALVAWLGPSTGAYMLMLLAGRQVSLRLWIIEQHWFFILIELLAFLVLAATGLHMRSTGGLKGAGWLRAKLAIVVAVFIPFQAAQIVIYARTYRSLATSSGFIEALALYNKFNMAAAVVFALAVPAVFFLAAVKPREKRTASCSNE
ncbi:MAG: hypothetical protein HS130_07485 [Deltaproteobacteria bacterium]|nr:hypothetical protein [Deltaproteobacteria bacterium]MCL4873386.1 hypothetical protein [bacterium]